MSIVLRLRKPWYTESSRVLPGNLAAMSPVAPSGTSPGLYMPFLPSTSDHTFLFAFCHPEIELSNLFPFVFLCGYFIVASWRRGGKCPCSAAILNLKLYHSCLVFIYFFLGIFFFILKTPAYVIFSPLDSQNVLKSYVWAIYVMY